MISDIVGPVTVLAIFFLGLPFLAVSHGATATRIVVRIYGHLSGDEERFSQWGLDKEMYGPSSLKDDIWVSSGITFFLALYSGYNYFWLVGIEADINRWYDIDSQIVRAYFTLCGIVWYIGIMWNIVRLSGFFSKAEALNRLSEEFWNCYTKLDILSLYDNLRFAPSIYWEKFAATPVNELTPQLLEKYSGYAKPYQHHHFANQNKMILFVAIMVGIPAIIIAAVQLFV